ncbi:hypothetical protein QR665_17370, partial [Acinetobacter gerneri]|nr:hypothetical protein [Acinetobacter gerneri]
SVICGPIGCAVDFVCRLLHLKIISLKKPLQIGLCNKATGSLNVKWGNQIQDSCRIDYQLSKEQINAPLIKLDTVCKRGHLE